MHPDGTRYTRGIGVGTRLFEDAPLNFLKTSRTLQLCLQHRAAGHGHMNMAINKTGYDQSVPSIQMLNIRAITIRDNLVATNTGYFAAVDQHCFGPWPVRVCGADSSASN
jgi:hypothetical protein